MREIVWIGARDYPSPLHGVIGIVGAFALAVFGTAHAAILDETVGAVTPVIEPDFALLLRSRIEEANRLGLIEKEVKKARDFLRDYAAHPVEYHLPKAKVDRGWSVSLASIDGVDAKKADLPPYVTKALSTLKRDFVFIDGNDKEQVAFARRALIRERKGVATRVILLAGSICTVVHSMKREKLLSMGVPVRLFADQGGILTRRFGIKALPAIVSIRGLTAECREISKEPFD